MSDVDDVLAEAGVESPDELRAILASRSASGARDHVADGVAAVERAQAAAGRRGQSFTHGGETFAFRPVIDVRVQMLLERERLGAALALALEGGEADVDRLLAVDEPLPPQKLQQILQDWVAGLGTSLGG